MRLQTSVADPDPVFMGNPDPDPVKMGPDTQTIWCQLSDSGEWRTTLVLSEYQSSVHIHLQFY